MSTEFKYANILRAIADDHELQWLDSGKNWVAVISNKQILIDIGCGTALPPWEYRIKPKTININGHEVPEPLRVEPDPMTTYFVPQLAASRYASCQIPWYGDEKDKQYMKRGLVHLTQEAAAAHGRALASFTETAT